MNQSIQRPFVAVTHGSDAYSAAREALAALDLARFKGARVLLKPNAGRRVAAGTGVVTAPAVVAAACDHFLELGADVAIGEGTIVGVKPLDCLATTGIAAVADERNLALVDLDTPKGRKVDIPGGTVLSHVTLAGPLADYDAIVSIPVMKTHMHCRVSLGLKNMKGCLRGHEKVRLHQLPPPESLPGEKPLNCAIADLARVLRPDVTLVDGSVGQEGLGPSAGSPKRADLVVASTDVLAADAVAATLMGFDPADIPHLRLSAAKGLGTIALDEIEVAPATWREWIQPFEPPPDKLSVEFDGVSVLDKESCSACLSTLLMFLKRYYAELGDYLPLTLAIGKGHVEVPDAAVCIGNCAARARVKIGEATYVQGCPPVASDILRAIDAQARIKPAET
jgi:uncharacterized protein (DUF362 family)